MTDPGLAHPWSRSQWSEVNIWSNSLQHSAAVCSSPTVSNGSGWTARSLRSPSCTTDQVMAARLSKAKTTTQFKTVQSSLPTHSPGPKCRWTLPRWSSSGDQRVQTWSLWERLTPALLCLSHRWRSPPSDRKATSQQCSLWHKNA